MARSLTEAAIVLDVKSHLATVEMRVVLLTRQFDFRREASCR